MFGDKFKRQIPFFVLSLNNSFQTGAQRKLVIHKADFGLFSKFVVIFIEDPLHVAKSTVTREILIQFEFGSC